MDFLRKILGEAGDGGDENERLNHIFDMAMADAKKIADKMVDKSETFNPTHTRMGSFEACLYLFIVTWIVYQRVWLGVEKTNQQRGPRNQVNRLWSLVRTAFSSGDEKTQLANMAKFEERWEEGFYDQWQ